MGRLRAGLDEDDADDARIVPRTFWVLLLLLLALVLLGRSA
jgi:hypothetical protein